MPDSLWQTCQFYAAIVRKRYKKAADAGRRIEMGFASFPVEILFKESGASFQIFYINCNVCQLHPSAPRSIGYRTLIAVGKNQSLYLQSLLLFSLFNIMKQKYRIRIRNQGNY